MNDETPSPGRCAHFGEGATGIPVMLCRKRRVWYLARRHDRTEDPPGYGRASWGNRI